MEIPWYSLIPLDYKSHNSGVSEVVCPVVRETLTLTLHIGWITPILGSWEFSVPLLIILHLLSSGHFIHLLKLLIGMGRGTFIQLGDLWDLPGGHKRQFVGFNLHNTPPYSSNSLHLWNLLWSGLVWSGRGGRVRVLSCTPAWRGFATIRRPGDCLQWGNKTDIKHIYI